MRHLNWKLLTAFEAVARNRNFTLAATELNVQQPAVSRRVAALESELGTRLVRRTRPRATLTREGELLHHALSGGMMQVRTAIEEVRRHANSDVVTLNTTIGFASCYLMKRLHGFRSANPDVSIELVSRDQNDSYYSDAADVVIVFDHPQRLTGVLQANIFSETLVAVARPDLFEDQGDDIAALAQQKLLHLTKGIHGDDWQTFFDGTGVAASTPTSEQRYTSFMVYLQAALNGEGIILGWETLLRDHFDQQILRPVCRHRVRTERGYFACLTARAETNPSAIRLWEWLANLSQEAPASVLRRNRKPPRKGS